MVLVLILKVYKFKTSERFQSHGYCKMAPGLRTFEKYAVQIGGGWNHRLDLSSATKKIITFNSWRDKTSF